MKKALLLLILCLFASNARAAEMSVSSRIARVTVYQDRALVTREASVDLTEGPNTLAFDGLPPFLQEESLRGAGRGNGVTISGVEVKRVFGVEQSDPRLAAIQKELETLQEEMSALQSRMEALQNQRQFLENVKNFSSAQVSKDLMTKGSSGEEWAGLSKFMLDSYTELGQATLDLQKAQRDKQKQIIAKQQEMNDIYGGGQTQKKTVLLNVEAKSNTKFEAELSYVVPAAQWGVSYDAKVYPGQKSCTLVTYGNVRQWTGEDWTDVKLTLSSAKPAVGGRMPELSPWFVDFYEMMPMLSKSAIAGGAKMKRARLNEQEAMYAADAVSELNAPAAEPAQLAQAAVSQELGSVVYEVAKPTTVLADNRAYKTPVHTQAFALELDYEATPKLSPYAFIHSKITNDKENTLAGGPISVFVDDNYVGQSSIPTVGRGESFDLYLGIDEEIRVKRTELVDKKKKALLGLRTRKDFAYKIELENYKAGVSKIALYDQIPVSRNAEIKAELVSSSVKPSETKDLGILKWQFELAAKEKKALEFEFFVEYPADKNVSGV